MIFERDLFIYSFLIDLSSPFNHVLLPKIILLLTIGLVLAAMSAIFIIFSMLELS